MLKFAVDENFNLQIVKGVLRRRPDIDIVRVQDAGFEGADDPTVLEWAASEGRVLLTHEARSLILKICSSQRRACVAHPRCQYDHRVRL